MFDVYYYCKQRNCVVYPNPLHAAPVEVGPEETTESNPATCNAHEWVHCMTVVMRRDPDAKEATLCVSANGWDVESRVRGLVGEEFQDNAHNEGIPYTRQQTWVFRPPGFKIVVAGQQRAQVTVRRA